jgi:hypothetical protein
MALERLQTGEMRHYIGFHRHEAATPGAHAMRPSVYRSNPFLMMTDPESILDAVEHSDRLNHLRRHVFRPLDRPLIPRVNAADLSDFDAAIDIEGDSESEPLVA